MPSCLCLVKKTLKKIGDKLSVNIYGRDDVIFVRQKNPDWDGKKKISAYGNWKGYLGSSYYNVTLDKKSVILQLKDGLPLIGKVDSKEHFLNSPKITGGLILNIKLLGINWF